MATEKTTYVQFFAPVTQQSIGALMQVFTGKMREGTTNFVLLISTPGGEVISGLTAYNFLKGLPATVTTHNIGSVDSIGVVMYCAGTKRISVPHARFLLHEVKVNFGANSALEERQMEETLKGIKIDHRNIAKVVSDTLGEKVEEVVEWMKGRTVWNPEEAKEKGLVTAIESTLFPIGADVVTINA